MNILSREEFLRLQEENLEKLYNTDNVQNFIKRLYNKIEEYYNEVLILNRKEIYVSSDDLELKELNNIHKELILGLIFSKLEKEFKEKGYNFSYGVSLSNLNDKEWYIKIY